MTQSTFNPTPGVSTHNDARSVWNGNAADAESRLSELAAPGVLAKSSSYTILPGDAGKTLTSTRVSSAMSFKITDSASFATGATIEVVQGEEGALSLVAGAGTTINRSRFATLELGGRYSTVRLRKQSAGTWIASGDLKEVQPSFRFRIEDEKVTGVGSQMNATGLAFVTGSQISQIAELSSGKVRILQSGTWLFSANLTVADSEGGTSRSVTIDLERNGVTAMSFNGRREGTSPSLLVPIRGTYTALIAAGDLVSLTTNSIGTINPTSGSSQRDFWATRISD